MGKRTTFRSKLLLLTILPLAVAQAVTLYAVMRTVERDVRQQAKESLSIGALVANEFLAARAEQLRTSVAVLAADYGLKEATATGDEATIRSVLENHSRRVGADVAALFDLDGALVASTLDESMRTRSDLVRFMADASRQRSESTTLVDDTAYHLFTVPLRAPLPIGWVVLGFEIDTELAARLYDLTGLDVSLLYAGGTAPTVLSSRSASPADIDLRRPAETVYMAQGEADQSLTIQTPFVRGGDGVFVVLQRSVRDAMQPYVEARRGLLAFGAALLAVVAVAVAWFSTSIASPLRTLGAAARRMISGDYGTQVTLRSRDEFGELADSFNAMQTAIAEREQRISHQALHDLLTDLPNRASVLKELTLRIEQARTSDRPVAVLSISLARMGEISSTLGHDAADELVKMAAKHLRASLAEDEVLGRSGTNEFVLVLPGQDSDDAQGCVERIDKLLGSGVTLGRVDIMLQTEVGIAVFPRHGKNADDLLRFASIARTEAEKSSERVRVYQAGRKDEFVRRLRIVNDLPSALRRGEIEVYLQPKVALPGGEACGAEALVRWQHPELGNLRPDDFIPAAEQSGTIVLLTRHVLSEAVRHCCALEKTGHTLQISVNLATRDLLDEYLPYHVMQTLKDHRLPAERLTLEVTESSIMEDVRRTVIVLELLRDLGAKISMDDFGTGHSSLAQLRNIPLDELKIDKSFVMTLCEDAHNDAIVRTTIELAHGMGLSVVAEGVEDEAALRRIAALGCEQAQGYFLSKPLAAAELVLWLQRYEPRPWADRRGTLRALSGPQAVPE